MNGGAFRLSSALATALMLLASCSADEPDPTASPSRSVVSPSATDIDALDLLEPFAGEIQDAPRRHHDRYAGFAADIPRGWKLINDGFGYHYAPSTDAFWVYPDHQESLGEPAMFSVWIVANQDASARTLARSEFESARNQEARTMRRMRVAGRTAYEVRDSGRGCRPCTDRVVLVQWDRETSIRFHLFTYRNEEFESRVAIFQAIYGSLERAQTDASADQIRRFLRARRAGHGAEQYLSPAAEAAYERNGSLYSSRNCGDITGYRVLSVVRHAELGTLYEVEAGDMEVLRIDDEPGTALIAEWEEFRACGTS